MNYPLLSEYVESIKSAEDNLAELNYLHPVLDANGDPVLTSGNFAVVFKMQDKNTGQYYALKCFTKEQEGRAESYRMIAEELENVETSYLTHFRYYDNELFVDCANTVETEFPVVLMDWVEGLTLGEYIREHIVDQYALEMLAYQFSRLAMWLLPQAFAHGDLKPDNILVQDDGSLVLVDYDGMYVPAMKGQKARELGSPDFRHPSRTENDFDEHIDDFAVSVMLLSLKAISLSPNLFSVYGNSERLLFSSNDFVLLSQSQVMSTLYSLINDNGLAKAISLFLLTFSQNKLKFNDLHLLELDKFPETTYLYSVKKAKEGRYKEVFEIMYPLAEEGYAKAQFMIGYLYLLGKGVDEDDDKAEKWLSLAKNQNLYRAYFLLGVLHEKNKKYSDAYYLFYEGANLGNDKCAQFKIGLYYEQGKVVGKDIEKAYEYFHKSAEQDYLAAQRELGDIYRNGLLGKKESPEQSIFWYKKAAEQGDSTSQFYVGYFYYEGYGVDRDYVEAVKWYKLAAEQNNRVALNNLGVCYEYGRGVESNKAIAVSYFEKSAVLGYEKAQKNLSICYLNGSGIEKNLEKAFEWGLKSATNHNKSSQEKVAEWFFKGVGTKKDKEQALIWYTKSKLEGDKNDVVIDTITAINALTEMADNNDVVCQYIIGKCYEYGVGVVKDKGKAKKWFEMAMNNGFVEAFIKLGKINEIKTQVADKKDDDIINDAYGVEYSKNSKVIVCGGYSHGSLYEIKKGTRVISDDSFCYSSYHDFFNRYIIPWSVVSIGKNPFACHEPWKQRELIVECNSSSFKIIGNALFTRDCKRLISYFGMEEYYSIPSGVEIIGSSAFQGISSLKRVKFPLSLHTIEDKAFYECYQLKRIRIPENVTAIGKYAFYGCESLEQIDSLGNIKIIKEETFKGCNLSKVLMPDSLLKIEKEAFCSNQNLNKIVIPKDVETIATSAFAYCGLQQVELNSKLKEIGNLCFYNCPIKEIVIPSQVKIIGSNPFVGTKKIECQEGGFFKTLNGCLIDFNDKSLISYFGASTCVVPLEVKNIKEYAFCESEIESVTINENIDYIGNFAFYQCRELINIDWCKCYIKAINKGTFYDCQQIKDIIIPTSVRSIAEAVFYGCSKLKNVFIKRDDVKHNKDVFDKSYMFDVVPRCYDSSYIHRCYDWFPESIFEDMKNVNLLDQLYVFVPANCDFYDDLSGYSYIGCSRNIIIVKTI